jgi:thiamine pyrophosphate-dependent acetolactate synthase large subunit-like protein
MGEPVRPRHDRADRLFLRLLRHARLRRVVDAGDRFALPAILPEGAGVRIAEVDIRAENIGRRAAVDLGIVGDVGATLEAVLPLLRPNTDGAHLAQAREHYAKTRKALNDLAIGPGPVSG